jgi:BirA family biotin operon repressor/biotin-[acetyl-CoA-carboxylase] ligase
MKRVHYQSIGSTNDAARRLLAAHPGEAIVVSAGKQTAGRGRLGRTWESPAGGVWLSIVWPIRGGAAAVESLALVAGLGVLRAIEHSEPELADRLRIKWPNDVLLDGMKIAGVLCKRAVTGAGNAGGEHSAGRGASDGVVIGIGVNADFPAESLAGGALRSPATTLADALGRPTNAGELRDAIVGRVTDLLDAAANEQNGASGRLRAETRTAISERLAYVGEEVAFSGPAGRRTGVFRGIDGAGRALVETDAGDVPVSSGEVDSVRAAAVASSALDTSDGEPA